MQTVFWYFWNYTDFSYEKKSPELEKNLSGMDVENEKADMEMNIEES